MNFLKWGSHLSTHRSDIWERHSKSKQSTKLVLTLEPQQFVKNNSPSAYHGCMSCFGNPQLLVTLESKPIYLHSTILNTFSPKCSPGSSEAWPLRATGSSWWKEWSLVQGELCLRKLWLYPQHVLKLSNDVVAPQSAKTGSEHKPCPKTIHLGWPQLQGGTVGQLPKSLAELLN